MQNEINALSFRREAAKDHCLFPKKWLDHRVCCHSPWRIR